MRGATLPAWAPTSMENESMAAQRGSDKEIPDPNSTIGEPQNVGGATVPASTSSPGALWMTTLLMV